MAPALWDPRALKRVQSPQKVNNADLPGEYYKIHSSNDEPEPLVEEQFTDERTFEECYNLDYPDETAFDLRETLIEENDMIIVTVWFENYQSLFSQNMVNQDVRGTLWNIICKHHPNVLYTEADLSHYNRNAYGYQDLANELFVDVDGLYSGPLVAIMHDQKGITLKSDKGPRSLVEAICKYLNDLEMELYGKSEGECDYKQDIVADNHYSHYLPYYEVKQYEPAVKQPLVKNEEGRCKL